MKKNNKYFNATQAASFMGISRQYFYDLITKGIIPQPVIRIGKRNTVLYDREAIAKAKRKWKSGRDSWAPCNID